jgi:hypothetical protein
MGEVVHATRITANEERAETLSQRIRDFKSCARSSFVAGDVGPVLFQICLAKCRKQVCNTILILQFQFGVKPDGVLVR